MIFLLMGASLVVLVAWSIVSTPRVVRRYPQPRVWMWWACWLAAGSVISQALIAQGLEMMGVFR